MLFDGFFQILLLHRREKERKRMPLRAELAAMQKVKGDASSQALPSANLFS